MYQILSKSWIALFVFVLPLISFASTSVTIKPMIQLSPKVRVLEQQTPTATQDSLSLPYLEFPRLLTAKQLQRAARVLGANHGKQYLTDDELLFISGKQRQLSWGIFHLSQTYTRDEYQVVVLKQVAWAELKLSNKQMSGLQVTKQLQEILVDDIALPVLKDDRSPLNLRFYPQSSPPQSVVTILGGIEDAQYAAHNQVVVIDRGTRDDLAQGHVFELYQKGSQVLPADRGSQMVQQALDNDFQFPDSRVGRLMVIQSYEHFSLALITESRQPIGRDTLVKSAVIAK